MVFLAPVWRVVASRIWATTKLMAVSLRVTAFSISTVPTAETFWDWAMLKKEITRTVMRETMARTVMMATPRFPRRPRKWEVTNRSLINFGNFIGCEGFPWIETGRLGGAGLLQR